MDEGELAPGMKLAARSLVVLSGAVIAVLGVLLAVRLWGEAGVGMGLAGEPGRFVAATCEHKVNGRGGTSTVCTGTFTSGDGRTATTGQLSSKGTATMAAGDAFAVRRSGDGTLLFVGMTDVAVQVATALVTSGATVFIAVATALGVRHIGSRRLGRHGQPGRPSPT
ncbi:hypothetical protein [Streptomyces sp. NPDC056361]|uniref:hypothetical protein n=1 Tax=Streptomyces sp. NPDC056361 TaxID=3345795 RepID=UPI0035D5339E